MPSKECPSPSLHPNPCKTLHRRGQSVSAEPSQHRRLLSALPRHPYLRRRRELCLSTPHPCHVQLRTSSTTRPLSLLTLLFQQHCPRPQFTKPRRRPFKVARVQFCRRLLQASQVQFRHRPPKNHKAKFRLQFAKCQRRPFNAAQIQSHRHHLHCCHCRCHSRHRHPHFQFAKSRRRLPEAAQFQSHHRRLHSQLMKPRRQLRAHQVQSCHHRHRRSHSFRPLTRPLQ